MHPFGVVCRALLLINISAHTKFEMPSFTRSKDMTGAQNLKMGHVTLTTPLSVVVCHLKTNS